MTTKPDDGGPAFPVDGRLDLMNKGMTLRQWYAGLAMQGLCSRGFRLPAEHGQERRETLAEEAVRQADALIAELKK